MFGEEGCVAGFCAWNAFKLCGVKVELWNLGLDCVQVMPGLRSSHGTSLDCAPMPRRIGTR
jgi:hypothetical protein